MIWHNDVLFIDTTIIKTHNTVCIIYLYKVFTHESKDIIKKEVYGL